MKIEKRQLHREDQPDGYLESDDQFHGRNRELINSILEPNFSNKQEVLELIDFYNEQMKSLIDNLPDNQ